MMRTEAPKDREGRGVVNLARTTPEFPGMQSQPARRCRRYLEVLGLYVPWGRVTLPQMTRSLDPRTSFWAL